MKRMFTNKQGVLWLLCLLCAGSSLHAQDKLWGVSSQGGQYANGAIYRVKPASQTLDVMHSLKPDTTHAGKAPYGSLIEYNGLLYGLTNVGGSSNAGVLFSYNPATNVYNALYEFDNTHGANPNGALTVFNNKLYGTTVNGGGTNVGVIFSFDPVTGVYEDVYDIDYSAGYNPNGSLVVYNNALYGTCFSGGGEGVGTVFRFDPMAAGNNLTSLDMSWDRTGALPSGDLVVYNGLLYGTSLYGGVIGGGTIFSCTPDMSSIAVRHHFPWQMFPDGEGEGGMPTGSLTVYDNKLYGLTLGGVGGMAILYALTPAADPANDVFEVKVKEGLGSYLYGNSLVVYNSLLYGMTQNGGVNAGTKGFLFSYAPGSSDITVLSETNGQPRATPLVYNNSIWGMVPDGGVARDGEIFRFDLTTQQYQRQVSFNVLNVKEGGAPDLDNFVTAGSKLYGTAGGGNNNRGILYSYDRSTGIYSKLVDFDDSTSFTSMLYRDSVLYGINGLNDVTGKGALIRYDLRTGVLKKMGNLSTGGNYHIIGNMAMAGANIYLVLSQGPSSSLITGGVYAVDTATGVMTSVHAFGYNEDALNPITGLVAGNSNVLYGQTGSGGQYGKGILYAVDPATGVYTNLYSLNGLNINMPGDLLYQNGTLYGVTPDKAGSGSLTLFAYTIATNSFTELQTVDRSVYGVPNGRLAIADNKLMGIGYSPDDVWQYDLSSNTFGKTVDMPASVKAFGANLLAISPLAQQITFNDTTVTYGKADFDAGAIANSGLPVTYTVEDEDVATVVNGKIHIIKAGTTVVTAAQPGSDDFFKAANVQRTLIIKPAPVQVTANDTAETYGKVNTTQFSIHYSGFVNNEDSTVLTTQPSVTTDATVDAHVRAANYTITPAGAAAANYSFTYVKGTLTVAPAAVTVKADDKQKLLGAADPAFTATATGFVNTTDSAQIMHNLVYTLTATGTGKSDIVPSGLQSTDYTFTYVKGVLTEDATAFDPVTAKTYGDADFTLAARTLNGATPTFTGNNTAVATVATNGDVHITGAGTITFTAHFPATGADPATTREQMLTIVPKALTVTAENKVMYTGDPLPDLTLQYSGFANSDKATSLTTQPVPGTTATAASPVGIYPIVVSGGVSGNYTFSYVGGTLTITNRPLTPQTITFGAIADKTYGDTDFASDANSDNASIPVTLKSSNTRVATIVNGNIHIAGSGTVTITASQVADATHSAAKDVAQTFTVNKALLTITADDKTKIYGTPVPNLSISYSGWVNNETVAVLTTVPVASVSAGTTTPAGSYPIMLSAAGSDNYTFRYVTGTLVVTAAQQTLTFPAFGLKKYGNPDFSANVTSTNSTLPVIYTSSNPAVATVTGNGTIHITGAGVTSITAAQPGNNNFADAVSISRDLAIDKASLVITPDDKVRIQGQANPAFTFNYTGLKEGDAPAVVITTMPVAVTTANSSSYPGNYAINASGAVANDNYSISYRTGTLKVIADTSRGADKLDSWMSSASMLQVNVFAVTSQKATVELFSTYGQRIAGQQVYLVKGTNTIQLPVGNIAAGLYIVRVTGQYMQLTQKVSINH